ncbi:MAG: hypothetical protein AB3N23_00710 [Paracoccaceae bacterium]
MRNRRAVFASILGIALPLTAAAQEPLSVIDWLTIPPASDRAGQILLEPPVAETGSGPQITVTPLATLERPLGLVPAHVTGLPVEMWQASELDDVLRDLKHATATRTPATQTLLYTLLLAESLPPAGSDAAEVFLLARLSRLFDLGAVEPAQALIENVGPEETPGRFAKWFDATLLSGDEHVSCAALNRAPHLSDDYAARMFCTLRKGDWSAAAVMLDAARALSLMPQAELFLLDRFLNPDLYELAPPLPEPNDPDPLTFRVFESIGEPLPTAPLPRPFAVADLRDVAGWKAQLEAAERLARSGAISPNRLLGIYTDRRRAASGGVWDRVDAVQRLDNALTDGDSDAVAKYLPPAWEAMQTAGVEVPFATVFAEQLAGLSLTDAAVASLAYRMRLLSPDYEAAAAGAPAGAQNAFLAGLARGEPPARGANAQEQAIADGFSNPPQAPDSYQADLDRGQLGDAILRAIADFETGRAGNWDELTNALRFFRAVGLEDTARRAALQTLILGPG